MTNAQNDGELRCYYAAVAAAAARACSQSKARFQRGGVQRSGDLHSRSSLCISIWVAMLTIELQGANSAGILNIYRWLLF